jgi:hypothetical protein
MNLCVKKEIDESLIITSSTYFLFTQEKNGTTLIVNALIVHLYSLNSVKY